MILLPYFNAISFYRLAARNIVRSGLNRRALLACMECLVRQGSWSLNAGKVKSTSGRIGTEEKKEEEAQEAEEKRKEVNQGILV